jgi:hypothetical protein
VQEQSGDTSTVTSKVDKVELVLALVHTRAVVLSRIDGYATRMRRVIYISNYISKMRCKKQQNMN